MGIPVNVPLAVRTAGGPFDIILGVEDEYMGFRTAGPAERRQVSSLAEPISVGSETAYSNEAYSQIIVHGFDEGGDRELFETGDRRYQWTDGKASLQVKDTMSLASAWEESDAGVTAVGREIVDFNAATCPQPWVVVGTPNLRALNTTSGVWADALAAAARTDVHLFANDQYLFASWVAGGVRAAQRWTGAALGAGWTALGGVGATCKCLGWYNEWLYCSTGCNLYKATANTGATWAAAVPVGYAGTEITDLYATNNLLFMAKPEGLFVYDEANVYMILDAKSTYSTNSFRGLCDWLGAVYLPWLNSVHQGAVNSSSKISATDITPRIVGDSAKERYGHGTPIKCIAGPNRVFVAFNLGEGLYPEVLCYDGVGWQQVYRGASGASMLAMGYSRQLDSLLINAGDSTWLKPLVNAGEAEYPSFEALSDTYSPFFDGGKPGELKSWRSLQLDAQDCSALNYINIYYRTTRTASWTLIGTVTSDGEQEYLFDPAKGHVAARKLQFRVELVRTDIASTTPKVKFPIILRAMVSSLATDAYHETVILAMDEVLNNSFGVISATGYTSNTMKVFLDKLRDSPYPVTRIDEDGEIMSVKVTDSGMSGDRPGLDTRPVRWAFALRWLDTRPGMYRQTDNHKLTIEVGTLTINIFDWITFDAFGVGSIGLSHCEG